MPSLSRFVIRGVLWLWEGMSVVKRAILERLAAISASPNAEDALEPLTDVPDARDGEGDVFVCGAVGHGIASWFFRLALRTARIRFDVSLPCWRALDDEEVRERGECDIRTVCRLALVALGNEDRLPANVRLEVVADEVDGCFWELVPPAGEDRRSGHGWDSLADLFARADARGAESGEVFIINP